MATRETYESELRKAWHGGEKMVRWCKGQSSVLVELSDGSICSIDKPHIETRFCFGYGIYREEDEAAKAAKMAGESEQYFFDENVRLAGLVAKAEAIAAARTVYVAPKYYSQDEDCKLVCFGIADDDRGELAMRNNHGREIGHADRELIVGGLRAAEEKFEKRLRTYLKRYGLSKVQTWTYWADA